MKALGTVRGNETSWFIGDLKPHVAMRFKQVFKGVRIADQPPFILGRNLSSSTDLYWFMQRYPLDASPEVMAALEGDVAAFHARTDTVEELRAPEYRSDRPTGFKEGLAPFSYQARAADLLRATGRLLLLDDVGLGKTVSFLAAVADGWGLPAVVVVQPHLQPQWVADYIEKFTHLKAHAVKDRQVKDLPDADIYVFRYSNIAAWSDYFRVLKYKTAVFDEIQELRHGPHTDKGCAAGVISDHAEYRMGLTATPIYNYGGEMHAVVRYIDPNALGSQFEFLNNWCVQEGSHHIVQDPTALGAYLEGEGLTLRRISDDPEVETTVPKKYKVVLEVPWCEDDVETDHELQRKLALQVVNGAFYERGQAGRQLDIMMRHETGVAKARGVAAYVRTLVEGGHKVLLAGWHRKVYDIWQERMGDLDPLFYTGKETQKQKQTAKRAFIEGDNQLLIMSLRSGAGVDGLQHVCHEAVFGEFDWSPQVHSQYTGRLARYGQQHEVTSHFLFTSGGSDPAIMAANGLKSSQSHGILNPYGGLVEATAINTSRIRALAETVLEKSK